MAADDTSPAADEQKPRLIVRQAAAEDIDSVRGLCRRVYPDVAPYSPAALRAHQQHFAEGQFVAVYEGEVVGYCATFRIAEAAAFAPHTWTEITGGGLAARHDAEGDWLYGMEVFVDPAFQGFRIGQRLYSQRKALCQRLGLKGIVFGGRLPALQRRIKKVGSAEAYVQAVRDRKMRDPVLSFQMRNGFEPIGVLENYLPSDKESLGYAAHLVWRNPKYSGQQSGGRTARSRYSQRTVRVSIVQYQQRRVRSFEEFGHNIEYFVDVVADYRSDFVVFPELFTLQLLSIENQRIPASDAIATLTRYTEPLKELLSRLAVSYNINIIGGSHPTMGEDGKILNICYVCLRDGSVHQQVKIHPTPNERFWWNIEGGAAAQTIMTDCGPIGVMICYDSEFPEMARHLVDQGAQILFVPFCTDERQSYLRVRYCAQARAVENQCYVVLSGNVGNLPNVENMDIQYAQSCILTPCDMPFARDGIAADTTPNVEMVAFADLRMEDLAAARQSGTVQNLRDRRFDLYSVAWNSRKG
ncbi:bifunctional GNAT family N-acetyltransferase/carbon-nitrogen hydrolase family protein [Roseospira navarrensis]|uniref:GNAT family N-acetyltransferase n=1 Tax=Roseospira navarrensis TaxID=140058 RepID=A0A7X1ZHI3_9PROT|nr:bifunctional GNAT family N-acetyltransferase/carbon-nitrogen hydrolase family protein [Roseospira navarrensis]MQX37741.1 GNAT family N-acetyltransferase [Roseospira navarrensis]